MKVKDAAPHVNKITMSTKDRGSPQMEKWWLASNDKARAGQLLGTAAFLKESQGFRYRQAAINARLYGNVSLFSFIGSNMSQIDQGSNTLPVDRPTFNLIQSCVDTLVSRISQSRPSPVFLTDNSDYKERNLAKKLNNFILGEFYQTKAYDKAALILRDALVEGTGCLKIYRDQNDKVGIDRVLLTELLVDPCESIYAAPRTLYQIKLVDRAVLMEMFPSDKSEISGAPKAYPDNSVNASKTTSDLVMVVEAWRLPSGPKANDGRHTIACAGAQGTRLDEKYEKDKFPFVFLHYSPRLLGFWSQSLAEQLMGTQLEINSLLYTISKAIKLVGVPRVFVENGSKVTKASNNNDIGVIINYTGVKPSYEVAPCVPEEMYAQLQRLIEYGYQQCGVSSMQATGQKPQGLNSGEAQRVYDDINTDRSAAFDRRWDNLFIDLAYSIMDQSIEISEDTGSYTTVYPNKNSVKEIDLPKVKLLQNPYVIQCFNMSSLPRDPAGRMQKITEMIQAGMISIKEGRRLLDYPDLSQIETLANASEERIFQMLDAVIESSTPAQADPFLDLQLSTELTVQYINLYGASKLEEEKMQLLRDFFTSIQTMKQAAQPPAPGAPDPSAGALAPQANPEPAPTSPLIPNAPGAAG